MLTLRNLSATILMLACQMAFAGGRFDVKTHGAVGDGTTLDTAAIQRAIDACTASGSGEVVFPPGRYLSGSLELKSGVHLVITPQAVLLGSRSMGDYTSRKLISATDAKDVVLEGGGTIDGQGEAYWEKFREYAGNELRGTAQFEYRALKRPSFIHLHRCRDVAVRNLTLQNSPSWTVHLQRCQNAVVEKVTIRNPLHGPNTDGIDINSCVGVTVRDCDIITGDDGVVLKSTEPGHDHSSRDITVEGCRIWSACNALKIGTETHDSFHNVCFRNCHLYCGSDKMLERPLSGVAIESVDGAHLSAIRVSDITMKNLRAPIFVRLGHRGGNSPRTRQVEPRVPGKIDDVVIRNVKAEQSWFESSITGIPGHCVQDVTLENLDLQYVGGGSDDWVLGAVPEEAVIARYPEAQMFGRLPAWGFYLRHVRGIRLRDVSMSCRTPDPRPLLVCDDVQKLDADGLRTTCAPPRLPLVWLQNVRDMTLRHCAAPASEAPLVAVEGSDDEVATVHVETSEPGGPAKPVVRYKPGELVDAQLPLVHETSPGLVVVEAETLRLVSPMRVQNEPEARAGKCVLVAGGHTREQGSALCRFEVSTPGEYLLWVRAYGETGDENSFYATIDRGPTWLGDFSKFKVWRWTLVPGQIGGKSSTASKVAFPLTAGTHTLCIRNRESGTKIDAIVLVRSDKNFDPERELRGK